MKMNIGMKIALGFLVGVVILIAFGIFALRSLVKVEQITHVLDEHSHEIELAADIQITISRLVMPVNDYIISADTKYKDEFREILAEVEENISAIEKIDLNIHELEIVRGVKTNLAKIKEIANKIFTMEIQTTNIEAAKLMEEMDYAYAYPAIEQAEELHEIMAGHMDKQMEIADKLFQRTNIVFITVIIFGGLIAAVIGILISKGISHPIIKLTNAAGVISNGDLTGSVSIKSEDEVGVLAGSFNGMVKSLRVVLTKVQDAVNQITSASNEILSASQEQAAGAREQSSAVAETSSAAKELSATSNQVGESINRVAQAASHALGGMAKIKEAIGKTSQMINSLGEKSQKISKITQLIDDVADQTNLLAVNASIEAARAGEQGKGFTVVADEIRKLSDSTAKSTKDITDLIEMIQHEMSNSVMAMEQSVKSVDEEAQLAKQTTEQAKEIAMSANQQISGSKQIADAMGNIDEAMKQISAGAQQSQLAVKQLTELAKELKDTTSKFKIK